MGSSLKPKSTRAVTVHSVPKSRRKLAPPKSSTIHRTADTRERRAEAILNAAKAAEPARAAADTLREMHGRVPMTSALRQIREKLDLVCSCAIVVEHALMEQNCELDDDAARVLKLCVGDELDRQIERIDLLLNDPPRDDDGQEDETGGPP